LEESDQSILQINIQLLPHKENSERELKYQFVNHVWENDRCFYFVTINQKHTNKLCGKDADMSVSKKLAERIVYHYSLLQPRRNSIQSAKVSSLSTIHDHTQTQHTR
jgi:hypothetical protein